MVIELDLYTLKYIEAKFSILSDMSTKCQGYKNLCELIDKIEKEKLENEIKRNK